MRILVLVLGAIALLNCSSTPSDEGLADVGDEDVSEEQQEDVEEAGEEPDVEVPPDGGEDVAEPGCELSYELPPGQAFALYTEEIVEPSVVAQAAGSLLGDPPPMVVFVDGLTDGQGDSIEMVGGLGERVGDGVDELPDTYLDEYILYFGALSSETCDFRVRLDGEVIELEATAQAERADLDLDGMSSLTEGLVLQVSDAEVSGNFQQDLLEIHDVVLKGIIEGEGFDAMVAAIQEQFPLSSDQIRNLLDPDDTGQVPVEMKMVGRQVVVERFGEPSGDEEIAPRPDVGACCPDGLDVGDSVLPFLSWGQQGLQDHQVDLFEQALPYLRADEHVAMVVTARRGVGGAVRYEVYSGGAVEEGMIAFERQAGEGAAPEFEIIEEQGVNPLANDDPGALSTYEEFLSVAINPEGTAYTNREYGENDDRVGFVPTEAMHYPFGLERISQIFDDPRAGDLIVIPASWSTGGFGTHGHPGSLQSRAPLVVAGPGVRDAESPGDEDVRALGGGAGQTLAIEGAARQVDIAPTVAAALGVHRTTGVGPDLRLRDDNYLAWQDGRVLEEVFDDDGAAAIAAGEPVAERAVIIVNDGLTHLELLHQVFSDDPAFDVEIYRRIFGAGVVFEYGAITNFPSNSFPGHNVIGSGAWSGHHGLVDNHFWERELGLRGSAGGQVFETEYLFGGTHPNLPVETLYEAVTRSFGGLDDGVMVASINTPSSRGAPLATFERRRPAGFELPDEGGQVVVGEANFSLPQVSVSDHTGVMDNSSVENFAALFQDHLGGEAGLPVPKLTVINFGTTDTSGHRFGPHGEDERFQAIPVTNERLEVIWAVLDELDLLDSTLIVLTADHGMELQDQSRASPRTRALDDAGIRARRVGWFVYFSQLQATLESVEVEGGEATVSLRIIDRATIDGPNPRPVEHVFVDVEQGGQAPRGESNSNGEVTLTVDVDDGANELVLKLHHAQWNPLLVTIELPGG